MTMKSRFIAHGSMVVGVLLAAGIVSGAARPPAEDRVPEAHSEKAKALHAPFGDTRTAATDVVAAEKSLYEGKGQCALCHGMVQPIYRPLPFHGSQKVNSTPLGRTAAVTHCCSPSVLASKTGGLHKVDCGLHCHSSSPEHF